MITNKLWEEIEYFDKLHNAGLQTTGFDFKGVWIDFPCMDESQLSWFTLEEAKKYYGEEVLKKTWGKRLMNFPWKNA